MGALVSPSLTDMGLARMLNIIVSRSRCTHHIVGLNGVVGMKLVRRFFFFFLGGGGFCSLSFFTSSRVSS
jgi:hypothetical protein